MVKTTAKAPDFLIREVQPKDANLLLTLANTPGMFNFPSTREAMKERIDVSVRSFSHQEKHPAKTKYMFVAEELKTGKIVATATISGQHGTEKAPHHYFKVGTEKRFSPAIQTGFIHGTLTLKTLVDGPSELGALVVNEEYRNHAERVGRQIFFSRFLYLHLHPQYFKDQLLAELLPPLNKKGHSPLWEAIGRRFTNLDYWEADALSSQNKEFIYDLFPQGKIYTAFLAADARNAVGKVSKHTEPVAHLLKRIGFRYHNEIDPFDGGPHLRAKISEITVLKKVSTLTLKKASAAASAEGTEKLVSGLVTPAHSKNGFRAVSLSGVLENGQLQVGAEVDLTRVHSILKTSSSDSLTFLPYF